MVYSYAKVFNAFAAKLSPHEAKKMMGMYIVFSKFHMH